jgi:hypothetical protein
MPDVATVDAKLVHALEVALKRASFFIRPFDHDGNKPSKRTPTQADCEYAYLTLQFAIVKLERGIRDQLSDWIGVTPEEICAAPSEAEMIGELAQLADAAERLEADVERLMRETRTAGGTR